MSQTGDWKSAFSNPTRLQGAGSKNVIHPPINRLKLRDLARKVTYAEREIKKWVDSNLNQIQPHPQMQVTIADVNARNPKANLSSSWL